MINTQYGVMQILTLRACNCNNSFNFSIFSKNLNGIELKLVELHFLSLKHIPIVMYILKVTIKFDWGASTFGMRGPWRINSLTSKVLRLFLCQIAFKTVSSIAFVQEKKFRI